MAAGLAAVLWLASAAINGALTWDGSFPSGVGGVLPATIGTYVWARPTLWAVAMAGVGAIGIALVHHAVGRAALSAGSRAAAFVVAWFAVVVAGAVVGLALDVSAIVGSLPPPRWRMVLDGLGTQASVGAYWGIVQGWIPALLATLPAARAANERSSADRQSPSLLRKSVALGALAAALLAVVFVGVGGQRAAVTASAQQEAIAGGFDEQDGALPDPYAEGTPPPTVAPDAAERDPAWCTPDEASLLLGEGDAATGHRTLSIELSNYSDAPCVAEGYIDIAFADQNGNELGVTVEPGGSFLTTDAGPQRIEIPAGASAVARLGWNANATAGALVATTLYAAAFPGDPRGSWPVTTDIVEGSTVHVTAWELSPPRDSVVP
jgi:hypothetical protein